FSVVTSSACKTVPGRAAPAKNTPVSFWTVFDGVHDSTGFVRGVDMRHLYTPCAPIQERRNNLWLVPHWTHDRRHAGQLGNGDAALGSVHGDGAVLVIQQNPIEPQVT